MNRTFRAFACGLLLLLLSTAAQSQWTQSSGPMGGSVWKVTSVGGRLFAQISSEYPTVTVSTDGGYNWGTARWGLPAETNGIRRFENFGEILFAQTDSGLFRSTDAGSSWSNASSGLTLGLNEGKLPTGGITQIGASLVFVSNIGLFQTTDQGLHWNLSTREGLSALEGFRGLGVVDTSVFFGAPRNIYRTSLNAAAWVSVWGGLPDTIISQVATLGDVLFVVTRSSLIGSYLGVYRSTDRGNSWTYAGTGLPETSVGYVIVIESDLYFIQSTSVFGSLHRSRDLGVSWSLVPDTLTGIWASNGVRYAQNVYADARLLRSTDQGGTWVPLSEPGISTEIAALATSGTRLFASTWNDRLDYVTTDRGNSWSRMSRDRVNLNVSALACCGSYLIAGGTSLDGGIDISSDNGSTWARVTIRSDAQIEYLAVDSPYVFAAGNGMWVSGDCGLSWKRSNTGLGTYPGYLPYLGAMAIIGGKLFATEYWGDTIFVSSDRGSSWTRVGSARQGQLSILSVVAEGGRLFAGTYEKGIWSSRDEGTTWTQCVNGLEDTTVNDIIAVHGTLFAGTKSKGVYGSTDAGESWRPVNEGLECPHINRLLVHGQDLYAGTTNEGVWRRPLSEVTGVGGELQATPTAFRLGQNYPNPFNPSTTIKYEMPKSSVVRLSVFDLLGREVSVLVNERRDAGVHEVKFDASGLSSGVYLYRLQAGGFVQSRKVLLVR